MQNATTSVEDYLRVLYKLEQHGQNISTSHVAAAMNVSSASATGMMKKLAEMGLVDHRRYQGTTLTEQGRKIALSVTRRHRLWEMFLCETLGFKWHEVHHLADMLEHSTTPELERRIDEKLGFPTTDPHGDPIPRSDGFVALQQSLVALPLMQAGGRGRVRRVSDESTEMLEWFQNIGIRLGAELTLVGIVSFDSSAHIVVDGHTLVLSPRLASAVFVEPLPNDSAQQ